MQYDCANAKDSRMGKLILKLHTHTMPIVYNICIFTSPNPNTFSLVFVLNQTPALK